MIKWKFVRLIICFLCVSFPAMAGDFQDDLKARREKAMDLLGTESILILWSAPPRIYSKDIEYEYRQDNNLFYLTGIEQQGTILALLPGNQGPREVLFIQPRNPNREHWQGKMLSQQEAGALSGIATVLLAAEFDGFIERLLSGVPTSPSGAGDTGGTGALQSAVTSRRARIHLLLDPKLGAAGSQSPALQLASSIKERHAGITVQDAAPILNDLRVVKTRYEQKVLRQSAEIAGEAQKAGMMAALAGRQEYAVKAAIEYIYQVRGAFGWSYPPIVGSGPNATILHYGGSDRRLAAGDLVLVDAGCNFGYMATDITRTYPVSGRFSEAQKDLYGVVLRAYEAGRRFAKAGVSLTDINGRIAEVIKEGLYDLGLITDVSGDQYRTWLTHGACHYIGMDVHDVGSSQAPLAPGMAFAMEPGVYIRAAALESLPQNAENVRFIEKVRPAVLRYDNIGIRVEDSFLVTDSGLECLSEAVPRTIDELERLLETRK